LVDAASFFKPEPLVRVPGPTLAGNRPKTDPTPKSRFVFPNRGSQHSITPPLHHAHVLELTGGCSQVSGARLVVLSGSRVYLTYTILYMVYRVFYTWLLGRPEIVEFWGQCGPGGPKHHSRRCGGSLPTFGMVVAAAGASQTPKIDDCRPAQKPCIRNPCVYYTILYYGWFSSQREREGGSGLSFSFRSRDLVPDPGGGRI
jgi:hypothetical protein